MKGFACLLAGWQLLVRSLWHCHRLILGARSLQGDDYLPAAHLGAAAQVQHLKVRTALRDSLQSNFSDALTPAQVQLLQLPAQPAQWQRYIPCQPRRLHTSSSKTDTH